MAGKAQKRQDPAAHIAATSMGGEEEGRTVFRDGLFEGKAYIVTGTVAQQRRGWPLTCALLVGPGGVLPARRRMGDGRSMDGWMGEGGGLRSGGNDVGGWRVAGGGTGLGYAIAKELSLLGAQVMIAARRMDVLEQAADSIHKAGGKGKVGRGEGGGRAAANRRSRPITDWSGGDGGGWVRCGAGSATCEWRPRSWPW